MGIATESTHWYDRQGNPAYTIIGKNGVERNTTLRDARVHNYLQSVTEVFKVLNKPFLIEWLKGQVFEACCNNPQLPDETLEEYKARIFTLADEYSKQRRDEGTAIHSAIDRGFLNNESNIYYDSVREFIDGMFPSREWVCEQSFACKKGYGGKIDLHSIGETTIVIDHKSKEFVGGDNPKKFIYPEHGMQLAAYAYGITGHTDSIRMNLFIRPSDGKVLHYLHEDASDYEKFFRVLDLWKVLKNYDPSWE